MKRDIWGVFHDGVLEEVVGTVPGTLRLRLEIPYLRRMFDEPGTYFALEVLGCTKLRYAPYDGEATENPGEIQAQQPELLYVQSEEPLVLECVDGILEAEYRGMRVTLPSGVEVTYEALVSACDQYWRNPEKGGSNAA